MVNFTEKQIQEMMIALKWVYGFDNNTRELAILELEDLARKGCTLEHIGECHGCSASTKENNYCPLCDWEKRNPEYDNDELAMKIKVLEAGGEEAYKEKLKRQEEAKKKAEEEKNKATDGFKVEACRYALSMYFKGISGVTAETIAHVCDNILNASTKHEIEKMLATIS